MKDSIAPAMVKMHLVWLIVFMLAAVVVVMISAAAFSLPLSLLAMIKAGAVVGSLTFLTTICFTAIIMQRKKNLHF